MKSALVIPLLFLTSAALASPGFHKDVPGDFTPGADATEWLFAEIGPAGGGNWNMGCNNSGFNAWSHVRPGKMTIRFAHALKERPKGKTTLRFGFNCSVDPKDIRDFRAVGSNEVDAVYFLGKHADGTPLKPGDTVKTGDRFAVRMRVAAPPDELSLTFYTVNRTPDWSKKGRWELIELPGAPGVLRPSKRDPLLYGAVVKVPALAKELKLGSQTLVASINYTGADSRQYGICYGFLPYAFEFAGGAKGEESGDYRFYDFGPADGPLHVGAQRVSPKDTPAGFKWTCPPYGYYAAFCRSLDASMADWISVEQKHPIAFQLALPSNRVYTVRAGICGIGAKCYNNFMFMPYQGTLTANGTTLWDRTPEAAADDCYRFIGREAEEDENVYETYVKPYMHDVAADVEVGADGLLKVDFKCYNRGALGTPFNYLIVYPKGDAVCERIFRKQLANRRVRFHEFWRGEGDNWDVHDPLQAKPEEMGPGPLRLFARENAGYRVLPKLRPFVTEIGQPLRITAAPGQRISGLMLLNATRDADVTLELRGELPEAADPRILLQMQYRYCHTYSRVHRFGTNHYLPMRPRRCRANRSYGYALRVDLPGGAKPGLYRGTVVAKDAAGATASLPVELRILDVKLPDLSDHRIAMIGWPADTKYGMETAKRELGCTSAALGIAANHYGRFKVEDGVCTATPMSAAQIDAKMKLYKSIGFACNEPFVGIGGQGYVDPEACGPYKPFTPEWRACIKRFYRDIYEAARSNGLDNVVLDTGGEMGYEAKQPKAKTIEDAIRYFNTIHELVPEAKVMYRCNCWTTVKNFFPVLDVAGVRGGASWKTCDGLPGSVRAKKDYYTYSIEGRFLNGVHSWAHGAKGNFREWLSWDHVCNYNDFLCQGDCGGNGHIEMMPGPNGTLVGTTHTEAFRASVDDRKYLRLLDDAVAAAADGPEKSNATAFAALVRKLVEDAMNDRTQPFGYWTSYRFDGCYPWPALNLDLMREVCYRFAKALAAGKPSGLPPFGISATPNWQFGFEDGPLVRAGTAAATVVLSRKPGKGEKPRKAAAEIRDADGRIVRTASLKDNSQNRRVVVRTRDLLPGTYTLVLTLEGEKTAECPFVVLAGL